MKPKGKRSRRDIIILLIALMVLSFSISMLHAVAKETSFTTAQVEKAINPQLIAGDVPNVARALSNVPLSQQQEILGDILRDDRSPLSIWQKADLLLKLVLRAPADAATTFFKLIPHTPEWKEFPLLYACGLKGNEKAVGVVVAWLQEKNPDAINQSLRYVVDRNRPEVLAKLLAQGVPLKPENATALFWYAIDRNKSAAFVPLLYKQRADMGSIKHGYTFVVKAVEQNNLPMVKELLKHGASRDAFADPAVGTPLQMAIHKGFADIEMFLRNKGAQETTVRTRK